MASINPEADAPSRVELAIEFLDIHRRRLDEHLLATDDLRRATGYWVDLARRYGAAWEDIGHALGTTGDAARKAHTRRRSED